MVRPTGLAHALAAVAIASGPQAHGARDASVAAPTLAPGDAAPALDVTQWVKGQPVAGLEKGHTYVVDLWATWCVPCLKFMPHATALQAAHTRDVTVVAADVFERVDGQAREDLVRNAVETMGARMDVRVAIDGDRTMEKTWYGACGREGIPCTFVIDKEGKVAWIGHPIDAELVVDSVLAGTWDVAGARRDHLEEAAWRSVTPPEERRRQAVVQTKVARLLNLLNAGEHEEFASAAEQMIETDLKNDAVRLDALAWRVATGSDPESQELAAALRASSRALELTGSRDASMLNTHARVLWEQGEHAEALQWQRKAVAALGDGADERLRREVEGALRRYEAGDPQDQ